jgi:NTP pyrophosphatase (non-canonical NTP hydrolase)
MIIYSKRQKLQITKDRGMCVIDLYFNPKQISSLAIEYYNKRFGDNTSAAFIHLVGEISEIAFAIEKNSTDIAQTKITEAVAILHYISSKYGFDIEANIKSLYAKKMESLKGDGEK